MNKNTVSGSISIGNLLLGGSHPIRIQSMTNTDTNDIHSTVKQCIALAEAGCEMVRITTQGMKEVKSLSLIKQSLKQQGFMFPLVADVHFNAKIAEAAAKVVEKIRINPGNYTGIAKASNRYTDKEFEQALEIIYFNLKPLLEICKHNGTTIRIGVNHGSLSNRILARYGDTPAGMVESAMEFGRICQNEGFKNLVFSMKSSNVIVMAEATRLLANSLRNENMFFPIHLGVTEAGAGEDAIIKSALGIGSLLEEGIGDTIRVSLTGDPQHEIPVARAITDRYNKKNSRINSFPEYHNVSFSHKSTAVSGIGGNYPVGVIAEKAEVTCLVDENFSAIGAVPDFYLNQLNVIEGSANQMLEKVKSLNFDSHKPIILKNQYDTADLLKFRINSAIDFGSLLLKGAGNAIWLVAPKLDLEVINSTAFAILQATRLRFTRTEFISCPSCGRTLFDISQKLEEVKSRTSHLKNLKIAIMGCIVNGPGEMADADYGYIGAGKGKVSIYKSQTLVYKNIEEENALDLLIQLIKKSGDWIENLSEK